jgi:hypothetical protein
MGEFLHALVAYAAQACQFACAALCWGSVDCLTASSLDKSHKPKLRAGLCPVLQLMLWCNDTGPCALQSPRSSHTMVAACTACADVCAFHDNSHQLNRFSATLYSTSGFAYACDRVFGGGGRCRLSDCTGYGSGYWCMCVFTHAVRRSSAMKWDSVDTESASSQSIHHPKSEVGYVGYVLYECMLTVCVWQAGDVRHHDMATAMLWMPGLLLLLVQALL